MKKMIFSIFALVILGSASYFSPWVTDGFAKHRAVASFEDRRRNVQDGCGLNCADCGAKASEKAPFGRKVAIEYACGLLPFDSPEFHQRGILFVSFLGTVHSVQRELSLR